MAQDPFAQYAVNPAPATPENDPFAQYAGAEAGTDPFAQYDVMRQRPAIQPNPLDTVVPTALRVGGAVAGSALGGALAGPPGAVAGGAVGSGLFELVAEAYEKSRGLRDEINPSQVATQTA